MAGNILSIPEAAAILGVSRIAVFKRVKGGSIPAFRVGRSWAIARADLKPSGQRHIPPSQEQPAGRPARHAPAPQAPDENRNKELDSMGWD